MSYQGFILSSTQTIRNNNTLLIFQGRLSDGRRFHWTVTHPRIVFFIDRDESWTPSGVFRKNVNLRNLRGDPVDALYFNNTGDFNRARGACESRHTRTYEADVNPVVRYLMEHFIQGSVMFDTEPVNEKNNILYFVDPTVNSSNFTPTLKPLSIDIECSLRLDLYSIALFGADIERVLMLDPNLKNGTETKNYISYNSERNLLKAFFEIVRRYDPDIFIGWNVVGFDLQWLGRKCDALGIGFDIGTDGPAQMLEPHQVSYQWIASIPGRVALDGINMSKLANIETEGYSLSSVANKILGRKKLIETKGTEKTQEITRLFNDDKSALARYNLEDTRLVHEIFDRLGFTQLAVRRAQITGLSLDRVGGSVAAFDFLYLPRLHRRGYVADTHPQPPVGAEGAPGGLVLDSVPGFYRNVAVFDFKSLYPSIIRTFKVDPLAANVVIHQLEDPGQTIKGPAGLEFAEGFTILPLLIQNLWQEREKAKKVKDAALSQAVKIIMNSFYGVLGSPGCRFHDPRLAGTITRIGHWILTLSRSYIEDKGFRVIYGDTDSLFVHLGDGDQIDMNHTGLDLSTSINHYLKKELSRRFDVKSFLDIELEKIFVRFFMPTIRGEDTGSKKRYAGMLIGEKGVPELYFAGMESSRRDWTALAKEFQADLFTLLFSIDAEVALKDELQSLISHRHKQLYAGELDEKLVYMKGLHKRLEEYTKNIPPHVRAARMLDHFEGRIVRYVITKAGPEPIQKRTGVGLDYEHYSKKQLAPIADMVLRFFDMDYHSLTLKEKQLNLF